MQLNKPSPRLAILSAQLADKAADESFARALYSYSAQNPRTLRALPPLADSLPLPPSYSEDLEQWLAQRESERVHDAVLERQSAARSAAPAKPAATGDAYVSAKQPATAASGWLKGADVPPYERVGLWHYKTSIGGDIGTASQGSSFGFDCEGEYRPAAPGTKYGDPYDESKYAPDLAARIANTESATQGSALIGVKQPAAELTHSVCIKAHGFADWQVGEIRPGPTAQFAHPDNWRACTHDGWIPHTPTADSVCPVPSGVEFEARYGDGTPVASTGITRHDCVILWRSGSPENTIVAWRPVPAKDAS